MRFILVIVLFFVGLGDFPVGENQALTKELSSFNEIDSDLRTEFLDVFWFDFSDLIPEDARVRTNNTYNSRIKNERVISFLCEPGLVFLVCKLTKSYTEIFIDKYRKFLFQLTIQVNAP
jgi:hypothetical protein